VTENTVIHTGFGAASTIWDVAEGIDLSRRRAIVTGASSGIGIETARALAARGADVMLAVRDTAAGERAAVDIRHTTGNQAVRVGRLDLADLDSVCAFVAAWEGPLHLLINNAGIMALPSHELTDRGCELQFATNQVGHFALTDGLHDALAAGAQSDGEARISQSSLQAAAAPVRHSHRRRTVAGDHRSRRAGGCARALHAQLAGSERLSRRPASGGWDDRTCAACRP